MVTTSGQTPDRLTASPVASVPSGAAVSAGSSDESSSSSPQAARTSAPASGRASHAARRRLCMGAPCSVFTLVVDGGPPASAALSCGLVPLADDAVAEPAEEREHHDAEQRSEDQRPVHEGV